MAIKVIDDCMNMTESYGEVCIRCNKCNRFGEQLYQLTCTKEQLLLIARCIEDISRFASGQPELHNTVVHMLAQTDGDCIMRDEANERLHQAKAALLPNLHEHSYLKYNSTPLIGNTYQIYREIYHRIAIDDNWNNVYSGSTLPSGDMGAIEVKKLQNK